MVINMKGYSGMIGVLRELALESDRLQTIIDKCENHGEIYINPELIHSALKCKTNDPGSIYGISVAKLIKMAGRYSGLALQLRELLSKYNKWFYCFMWILALQKPGWFRIINFRPGKGGW